MIEFTKRTESVVAICQGNLFAGIPAGGTKGREASSKIKDFAQRGRPALRLASSPRGTTADAMHGAGSGETARRQPIRSKGSVGISFGSELCDQDPRGAGQAFQGAPLRQKRPPLPLCSKRSVRISSTSEICTLHSEICICNGRGGRHDCNLSPLTVQERNRYDSRFNLHVVLLLGLCVIMEKTAAERRRPLAPHL